VIKDLRKELGVNRWIYSNRNATNTWRAKVSLMYERSLRSAPEPMRHIGCDVCLSNESQGRSPERPRRDTARRRLPSQLIRPGKRTRSWLLSWDRPTN